MPLEPPAIIFDLDGTLIDSRTPLQICLNALLGARGLRPLSEVELQACMGRGLAAFVAEALALVGTDRPVAPVLAELRARYDEESIRTVRPFAGVEPALVSLGQSHRLALCTNKPRRPTEAIIERLGWSRHFEAVAALGDTSAPKPDPSLLLRVLEQLQVRVEDAVLVGDTKNDASAAHALGMRFYAVSWGDGQGPPEDLHPVAVLPSLSVLSELLGSAIGKPLDHC